MAAPTVESSTSVKRLTLDLPIGLHRALKVRAAELDLPMAELLRVLIAESLADPSILADVAARCGVAVDP